MSSCISVYHYTSLCHFCCVDNDNNLFYVFDNNLFYVLFSICSGSWTKSNCRKFAEIVKCFGNLVLITILFVYFTNMTSVLRYILFMVLNVCIELYIYVAMRRAAFLGFEIVTSLYFSMQMYLR